MATFTKVSHIGLVTRDLGRLVVSLKKLGAEEVGPLKSGTRGNVRMKVQNLKLGDLEIEVFEHLEGKSMISDFLDTHGEGVHHISCFVNDIEEVMKLAGNQPVYGPVETPDGLRIAFLDIGLPGGLLLEVEQSPDKREADRQIG